MGWLILIGIFVVGGFTIEGIALLINAYYKWRAKKISQKYPHAAKKHLKGVVASDKKTRETIKTFSKQKWEEEEERELSNSILEENFHEIERDYPNGLATWYELHPGSLRTTVVNKKHKIRDLEKYTFTANYLAELFRSQNEFNDRVLVIKKEIAKTWGHYYYQLKCRSNDKFGAEVEENFNLWQFFANSTCLETDLDYSHFQTYVRVREALPKLIHQEAAVKAMTQNKAFSLIRGIKDYLTEVSDDYSQYLDNDCIQVLFNASGMENPHEFCDYHFEILRKQLDEEGIWYDYFDEFKDYDDGHMVYIVVDVLTSNDRMMNACSELVNNRLESVRICKTRKLLPEGYPKVVYISYIKEYDREEMQELIEKENNKTELPF